MDRKIRIIIADSDPGFAGLLAESMMQERDMQVCALAYDGMEALELVKSLKPDVLVTDLMLRKMEGLCLMRSLQECGSLPHTIVLSGYLNSNMMAKSAQYGAECFFLKPCRIRSLVESIRECVVSDGNGIEKYIGKLVEDILISFGMSPRLSGFAYLRDAVCMISTGRMPLHGITKILYPDMGRMYNVSAKDVERCMRHAIKRTWSGKDSGGPDNSFTRNFRHKSKAPTNREMICWLTERVKELMTIDERQRL